MHRVAKLTRMDGQGRVRITQSANLRFCYYQLCLLLLLLLLLLLPLLPCYYCLATLPAQHSPRKAIASRPGSLVSVRPQYQQQQRQTSVACTPLLSISNWPANSVNAATAT